jgi:hypothetical protein
MSANSKIEWTDHTFNPWIGCTKVSPGCDHCYAERREDLRLHRVQWGPGQPRHRTKTWGDPVRWNKRPFYECRECGWRGETDSGPELQRVFCASLADVFDNEVDPAWRADLFDLIASDAEPRLAAADEAHRQRGGDMLPRRCSSAGGFGGCRTSGSAPRSSTRRRPTATSRSCWRRRRACASCRSSRCSGRSISGAGLGLLRRNAAGQRPRLAGPRTGPLHGRPAPRERCTGSSPAARAARTRARRTPTGSAACAISARPLACRSCSSSGASGSALCKTARTTTIPWCSMPATCLCAWARNVPAACSTAPSTTGDGRLYHPLISEAALDAWGRRDAFQTAQATKDTRQQRWRAELARLSALLREAGVTPPQRPTKAQLLDLCARHGVDAQLDASVDASVDGGDVSRETRRDGGEVAKTGTETETGRKTRKPERAADPPPLRAPDDDPGEPEADPPNGHGPTPAGAACLAMRRAGLQAVNPGDPRLLALLEQGATEAEFTGVAAEAVAGGKGWAWVLKVVEARRADAAAISLAPAPPPPDWRATRAGVVDRGCQLGLGPWNEVDAHVGTGPSWSAYKRSVLEADAKEHA